MRGAGYRVPEDGGDGAAPTGGQVPSGTVTVVFTDIVDSTATTERVGDRRWLELLGCAGAGKVYRFAQIVAAATLSLEISASAAMATAGSENFFQAHHERGGLR